jgi:hypothetical protein
MDTVLGLFGIALFIVGVIALASGVTYVVVRLTPQKKRKPADEASS